MKTKLLVAALAGALVLGSVTASPVSAQTKDAKDGLTRIAGRVSSISGATFTVETPGRGEIKVQTDSKTEWLRDSKDKLAEGAFAAAAGTLTGDVLHAQKVAVGKKGAMRGQIRKAAMRSGLKGEITEVNDRSFSLRSRRGEVTVNWDDETVFRGGDASDLEKGTRVAVVPNQRPAPGSDAPKSVTARAVHFPKGCDKPAEEAA